MTINLDQFNKPKLSIYFIDMLMSAFLGWGALLLISFNNNLLYLPIAIIFLSRGHTFIHEVIHQKKKIPIIEIIYNSLFGYPSGYPSYIYYPHHYHHSKQTYGTKRDPEYKYGVKENSYRAIFISLILPLFAVLRFSVFPLLYPIISKKIRIIIFETMSTLVVNPKYIRHSKNINKELKIMKRQDLYSSFFFLIFLAILYFKIIPAAFVGYWYFAFVIVSYMNSYRALKSHHYNNESGTPMTIREQLLDTTTLKSTILNFVIAPVGLRYHAAHHLYPTVPYHNLEKLHQQLLENEDYQLTIVS